MSGDLLPSVTVVISTRDRGDRIGRTIRTIQAGTQPDFELWIVDQSRTSDTEASVREYLADRRIRYIRSAATGVSTGRNTGIASARNEIIAITDDDCEVAATWLEEIEAAFRIDPRIAVVFGNVLPCEHDPKAGFVPAYMRKEPFLARRLSDKLDVEGGSACMALRRSVWHALGGFDEMLGAGAPLRSAAETDFTVRCLVAGYFVFETPRISVVHHEFLNPEQGRAVVERYWFGTGAMYAKQLKCGHWSIIQVLVRLAWRWALGRSRFASSLGATPFRLYRLVSFLRGFVAGGIVPVDRATSHYVHPRERRNHPANP
jgi:glycosyltransferase involved in cell wall biosynthesis